MRFSLVIAAHNEGDLLWRTVESCMSECDGLDYEIVVANDASWDNSIADLQSRFPRVRVFHHEVRRGASATKDLGARNARGDTLLFLDGHSLPEPGAIARLVEDVELLRGKALVTPTIASLDAQRWKNTPTQIGHGYFLDLEEFHCGWLPLAELRASQHGPRRFYESPALIGCAFAISRELYEDLWGFDSHMRFWGVEDLDFSLKAWLMGHPILHDPDAVIGHRFRESFDNYSVPYEHILANQLRMARKSFTQAVWSDWVDRCRQRHLGRLQDHPEGIWARAWMLFEEFKSSVEQERRHLLAARIRDEFWYAQRFGLTWPRLKAAVSAIPEGAARLLQAEPSPSPSPPPCKITKIIPPSVAIVCAGKTITFTAEGSNLANVKWTAPKGTPDTGTGKTFTTKWDTPGDHRVTGKCGNTSKTVLVTAVQITFNASKYVTGFTIPVNASTLSVGGSLTCTPASMVNSVTLKAGGEDETGKNRITIVPGVKDPAAGTYAFQIKGKVQTPADKPGGDTTIQAVVIANTCAESKVVVVVPDAIGPNHPQPNSAVVPVNQGANLDTTPVYTGALPPNYYYLWTLFVHWLAIPVVDQFGNQLDAIYEGQEVFEKRQDAWQKINQRLDNVGTYSDPVGATLPKEDPPRAVPASKVAAWEAAAPQPMEDYTATQNFGIMIGGHTLNPGIKGREVIATPPYNVQIIWP